MTDNDRYRQIDKIQIQSIALRSEVERITMNYFYSRDFTYVEPPILHEQIKNKKNEIYLPLYDEKYSLNSSNALFMGMYAAEFGNVFTVSKCFRDENETINHLVEFDMLEVEMLNYSFEQMIELIFDYIGFVFSELLTSKKILIYSNIITRIKHLTQDLKPRKLTYNNFVNEYNDANHVILTQDISNIDALISMNLKDIFIIVDYPTKYATWTAQKKDANTAFAFNIILPDSYGELCEGCQRTNDFELLQYKINCANVQQLQWYVDSVKKINVNRCGFGLGMDRLMRWIIGADTISECKIFPRTKNGGK